MNINQRKICSNIIAILFFCFPQLLSAQEYIKGEPAAIVIDKQQLIDNLYKQSDKKFEFNLVNVNDLHEKQGLEQVFSGFKGVKKAVIGKMNKKGIRIVKVSATSQYGMFSFRKMLLEASINILYVDGVAKDVHYLKVKDAANPLD